MCERERERKRVREEERERESVAGLPLCFCSKPQHNPWLTIQTLKIFGLWLNKPFPLEKTSIVYVCLKACRINGPILFHFTKTCYSLYS